MAHMMVMVMAMVTYLFLECSRILSRDLNSDEITKSDVYSSIGFVLLLDVIELESVALRLRQFSRRLQLAQERREHVMISAIVGKL